MKKESSFERYKKYYIVMIVFLISLCLLATGRILVYGAKSRF